LVVRKQTTNPDDFDQDFNFVGGVSGTTGDVAGTITDFDIAAEELSHTAQPGWFGSAEEDLAGWEITGIACEGQTDNAQVEIGTAGNFTQPEYNPGDDRVRVDVGAGETVICTFTNQPFGSLTIVKSVQGADATFNFTGLDNVNDPAIVTDFNIDTTGVDPDQQVFSGLAPGLYGVSELSPVPMGYDLTNIVCDAVDSEVLIGVDGDFDPGDTGLTVDLTNGEDVTCTFTNTQRGTITLVKNLPNDNGGDAVETDFTAFIDGSPVPWGIPQEFIPGGYTASESTLPGYLASDWFNDCAADGSVVLGPGENLTCEVTNDDIAPILTLVKTVINDNGGLLTQTDFPSFVNAVPQAWDVATAHAANVVLTASETPQTGYTPSVWGGDCATDGTITLLPGDVKTCTITNDDVAPTLTLVKTVTNDTGGLLTQTDFPSFVNAVPQAWDGATAHAANAVLTASETPQTGYTASVWGGDCAEDGTITLLPGDVKTCTITNDDIAPTLALVKTVTNDNGGSAVATDWILSATGPTPISGAGGVAATPVDAGVYTLSEDTGPAGYTPGAWSCVGGSLAGDQLTLGSGESATCTIDNNDDVPGLTLIKRVINGTALPSDFELTLTGADGTHDSGVTYFSGEQPTVLTGVSYTLSELADQVPDYTDDGVTCTDDADDSAVTHPVTLNAGQSVTCTQTNRYVPQGPMIPVPVDNKLALLLLTLMMLATGWYFRPAVVRKF
jgi:hypothetical protein